MKRNREKGLVSIVISNYNNEKYIEKCLNSIINQTYKNIEIIIVDDGSTDNSISIINSWILDKGKVLYKKDKIIFEKLPANIGFSGAVTVGLYLANGEYLAMQDGDDYSLDTRIEKQFNFLEKNKEIKVIGSNYEVFDNEDNIIYAENFVKFGEDEIREDYANGNNAVSYGTLMFKGQIFDKIGGLTRSVDGAEDYEYITKLLPYGINNLSEILYRYRSHENQRSREFYSKKKNKKEDLSIMLLLDRFNIGGTETHVLHLAKELINKGMKVTIVSGIGDMESEFKKLNCRIYNMDFPTTILKDKNKIKSFKEKIKTIMDVEHINIVHAHQSSSGSIGIEAAKDKGVKVVFTIHGMYYHDIVESKLKGCEKIISVSYPVYDWLLKYSILSKVIANGVDFNEFNGEEKNVMKIKNKYNIPKDAKVAMYCSRMAWGKIKTCENLIRVCRDLSRKEKINVHALVVGDGPGYIELKDLGEKVNKQIGKEIIHFTGGITNVQELYGTSNFIVGTGRVAIEAMASKKPLIATGNNGYVGLVKKENFDDSWKKYFGDHGSVKDNNAIYLYEDIKEILEAEDEYKKQAESIFNKSKETFDIVKIADTVIDIYLEAMN